MGVPPSLLSAWCPQGGIKSPLYLSTDALQHGHLSAGDFTFPGPSGFGHLQHPLSLSNPHFHLSRVSSRELSVSVLCQQYGLSISPRGGGHVGLPETLFALFRVIHTLVLLSSCSFRDQAFSRGKPPWSLKVHQTSSLNFSWDSHPLGTSYKCCGMAACPGDMQGLHAPRRSLTQPTGGKGKAPTCAGHCTGDDQPVCDLQVPGIPWRAGMPSGCQLTRFSQGKVGLRIFHPLAAHSRCSLVSSLLHRAPSDHTADISRCIQILAPNYCLCVPM